MNENKTKKPYGTILNLVPCPRTMEEDSCVALALPQHDVPKKFKNPNLKFN
jgi:hypothetical protein